MRLVNFIPAPRDLFFSAGHKLCSSSSRSPAASWGSFGSAWWCFIARYRGDLFHTLVVDPSPWEAERDPHFLIRYIIA